MRNELALDNYLFLRDIEDEQPLPATMSLSQNYPNPFNPGSTIEFSLDQAGEVTITIYNALGQTVRRVVGESYPAGVHRVQWNGRDDSGKSVPNGVYIYRMEAGGSSISRKMTLVK